MSIPKKVIKFLESRKINYEPLQHKTVYTATDKAATLRAPEKIIGKTLVMKTDKFIAVVLIPANKNLDKNKFKKIAKVKKIDFVKENWMKKNLKGIKFGAVPPFGNLWRLPTLADGRLMKNPKIIINVGDYNWSIKITPTNLKKAVPDIIISNFSKAKK